MKILKVSFFFFIVSVLSLVLYKANNETKNIHRVLASDSCLNLDEKLSHQMSLFQSMQDRFISEGPRISRSEYEREIKPNSKCELSSKELKELKERHEDVILQAKVKAKKDSVISIAKIQQKKKEKQFCQELPKGGMLHMHPSGVLDRKTIRKLGGYNENRFFLPKGQNNFATFDTVFAPLRSLLGRGLTPKLKEGVKSYLERAAKNGVIYVEFSKLFDGNSYTEDQLASWAQEFERDTGVVVRWKAGFIRVWGASSISSSFGSLIENEYQFRKQRGVDGFTHIAGVDLYGDETHAPLFEKAKALYGPLFAMKKDQHYKGWTSKLGSTAHSGELGDPRNPRDAMILGIDRIGHGVALKDRPVDLEYARRYNGGKGLPIEINLVSNYRLSSVNSYKEHPFLDFLRLGLPISMSTDDEGIFETTVNTECEKAIKYFDIEYIEFKMMAYNSIHTAFIDDTEKDKLIKKLDDMFVNFEKKWGEKYSNE